MLLLLVRLALLASLAGAVAAAPPSIEPEAILRHIQFLAADVEAAARATGDIEIRRGGPGAGRSDDSSFVVSRVPALHFFTGFHADYYGPGDDWDPVNGAGVARIATLALDLAARIAARTNRPEFVPKK